jgi:hypothetical protein
LGEQSKDHCTARSTSISLNSSLVGKIPPPEQSGGGIILCMDTPEWDDYKPKEIELPKPIIPENILKDLTEFVQNALEKENKLMSITSDVLDQLYREIGGDEETASLVISYIQRRHKWDVELLAERRDVDEVLYREHDLFDEHMWDKVMNSKAISDLHHEVWKLSQLYISRAINEVLRSDNGTPEEPAF